MTTYVKKTKHNVDFKAYNLKFLTLLQKEIKNRGWNRTSIDYETSFVFITKKSEFDYCSDVIQLIERLMSDDFWECRMVVFQLVGINKQYNSFTWRFRRRNKK